MRDFLADINLYRDNLTGLSNFFSFIEEDAEKIFGSGGKFAILNVPYLTDINTDYGVEVGDLCIRTIGHAILKTISAYEKLRAFRFGANDFLIAFPACLRLCPENITAEIEKEYINNLEKSGYSSLKLHSVLIEYHDKIETIEDFYFILLDNFSLKSEAKDDSYAGERIIKHIIYTFVGNIRNALMHYNNACTLALTDEVSGLSNNRSARLYLNTLIDEYSINKLGFSILFIDGDNLRRYNTISYEAGNQIIKKLSSIIKNTMRSEDKIYRWLSGDEFLIILRGTDKNSAVKLAERVREAVKEQTKEFVYPTTISVGIASYPDDGSSMDEVIEKAQRANGMAKNSGKNKVVSWSN